MIHQTAQHGVLASTTGTMVDLLLMGRAAEMLIQAGQGAEAILAKITAKVGSIPGSPGGDIARLGLMIVVPSDLLVGEDVVWIDLSAVLIDLLAIDTGCAGTGLQVETDAGEIGELVGTPRTLDVLPSMNGGFQMLH